MTTTLPPRVDDRPRFAPRLPATWLRSLLAGIEAALIGWILVVVPAVAAYVATAAAPLLGEASWVDAAVTGTALWVLGHGGGITMGDDVVVSLVPLGISLVGAALLYGTSRRARLRRWATAGFSLAGYVLTVLALSAIVPGPVGRGGVVLGSTVIGALALTLVLRRARALPPAWWVQLRSATPSYVRAGLRGGGLVLVGVLGVATAITAIGLIRGVVTIAELHDSLGAGPLGAVVLVLSQLAFLPTLVVWALGWLAGPGFAVGQGTVFSPVEVVSAPLPAVPLLGALPQPGEPGMGWVVLVPVLIGAAVGGWLHHRHPQGRWWQAALSGAVAAAVTAVVAALLTFAAAGGVGPGRMEVLGSAPPAVAGALAWQVLAGAVVVLVLCHPDVHAAVARGYRAVRARIAGEHDVAPSSTDDEAASESVRTAD